MDNGPVDRSSLPGVPVGGIKSVLTVAFRLLREGFLEPRVFVVVPSRRVAYLNMAKVACSSIVGSLTASVEHSAGRHEGEVVFTNRKPRLGSGSLTFTFVRNPFHRIASCYLDKICNPKKIGPDRFLYRRYPPFGRWSRPFRPNMPFDDFVRRVARIPDVLSDRHFRSQYSYVFSRGRQVVDYVGRFESLDRDFAEIRERFGLAELPHVNRGLLAEPYEGLFSCELLEVLRSRYSRDIEAFGYEGEYERLCRRLGDSGK